jgi:hypothetical protein
MVRTLRLLRIAGSILMNCAVRTPLLLRASVNKANPLSGYTRTSKGAEMAEKEPIPAHSRDTLLEERDRRFIL